MEQTLVIKKFDRLTPREVYEILRIRTAVFVVEQECPYQEVDGTDYDSLHVWLEAGDEIVAYLRIFEKDTVTNTVQIGRVLSKRRGEGLGAKVLENGIEAFTAERLERMLNLANAAASIVTTRRGALRVMPTPEEIEAIL